MATKTLRHPMRALFYVLAATAVLAATQAAPEVLVLMAEGGGSTVIEATSPAWRGPEHQAVLQEGGRDYLFFHAYFGAGRGRGSALQISTLDWENGWPRAGTLLDSPAPR